MLNDKIVQEFFGGEKYLLGKIKEITEDYKDLQTRIDDPNDPKTFTPTVATTQISRAKQLALSHLLLGEYKEAKRWFRVMAGHIKEYLTTKENIGNQPIYLSERLNNLRLLIICREKGIIKEIAPFLSPTEKDKKEIELVFENVYTWLYIVLNNLDIALKHAENYLKLEEKHWKTLGYYQGIAPASLGIIKQDQQLFNQGIQRILEIFPRKRAQKKYELWAPICEEAVALMLMAKDNNLEIDYSNPYTPAFFFEELDT
jgi:hypothetical protein